MRDVDTLKLKKIDNVTLNYEIQMLTVAFRSMKNQANAAWYNIIYECFTVHAVNLLRPFLSVGVPASFFDTLEKMERQVLSYPREEPTFEDKVKITDCEELFWWLIDKYEVAEDGQTV